MAAHIYWRLVPTEVSPTAPGNASLSAMELRAAAGGSNLSVTGAGTASASTSSYPASNAFDGNSGTYWAASTAPIWLQWAFNTAQDIQHLTLVNWGTNTNVYIISGYLAYSDNGTDFTPFIYFSGRPSTVLGATTHSAPAIVQAAIEASTGTVAAFGGANISISVASAEVVAFSGAQAINLTTQPPTLDATGHDSSGENAAEIVATSLSVEATGGANASLNAPGFTLLSSGIGVRIWRADLSSPDAAVTASGSVSQLASASISSTAFSLIGYGGAVCSVSIGGSTVIATGTCGAIGGVSAVSPLFEVVAVGSQGNHGEAILLSPDFALGTAARTLILAPGFELTAVGTAVVAVTYEAYALNLKHSESNTTDEVTRYTNFPFDRIVRHRNSYYGMNSTGLYLLEGTTDDGAPTQWEVETHITDFESPKLKTVQGAYFGGRLGPAATVTLSVGEKTDNNYSYTTPRGQTAQNYRQVFGKGAKARYFSLGVSGEDDFEVDSIEFALTELTRRI